MENQQWQEIVGSLVDAKRHVTDAWQILDGSDGAAPGVEHALNAALASVDAMFAIEHVHAANSDVATPVEIKAFWEQHGTLPGFAIGT